MDRLPLEVFCEIISLLDYCSILNCSLVCKKWNQSVNQSLILFETVQCHNFSNHYRIKKFFYQNQHRASRVKTLEYNFRGDMPKSAMEEIQHMFPNVEHFRLFFCDQGFFSSSLHARRYASRTSRYQEIRRTSDSTPETEDIGNWLNLKSVEETSRFMYASTMLNQCQKTYDHLTRIWLNFAHCEATTLGDEMDYLFTGFKKVPALESLTLTYAKITFDRLDKLHSSCPKMIDLLLIKPEFFKHPNAPHQRYILDIRPLHYKPDPANSLKNLTINEAVFVGGIPILEYIARKYPQIEQLVCNMDLQSHNGTEDLHQVALSQLAMNCKQLKYLDTNLCNYTSETLEAFDQHQSALEMEQFTLTPPQTLLTFETLSFTRFRYGLKKLNIKEQTYFDMNILISMMSQFSNLTSIELSMTEDEDYTSNEESPLQVPLIKFLIHQNHLKKLSLHNCYITVDQDPTGFQTNIEDLSMLDVYIEEPITYQRKNAVLLDFLSESCLNLKQLHVFGYWHTRASTKVKLNLCNHHQLSHADVYIKRHPYIQYLDGLGGERWFEREEHGDFTTTCYELDENPQEVDSRANYMTIKCKNADVFYTPKVYYAEPYRF